MNLMALVDFLILLLARERIDLSLHDRKCWHVLFYKLKNLPETPGKPAALKDLSFDAVRYTYPKCEKLDEYIAAICGIGWVRWGLYFSSYTLDGEIATAWWERYYTFGEKERHFLETMALELARETFSGSLVATA